MAQWVRSKYSEEAKKWEVLCEYPSAWIVWKSAYHLCNVSLLKEEYITCDPPKPPERWEVCTREVIHAIDGLPHGQWLVYGKPCIPFAKLDEGERWAMSEKDPDALVIWRRV